MWTPEHYVLISNQIWRPRIETLPLPSKRPRKAASMFSLIRINRIAHEAEINASKNVLLKAIFSLEAIVPRASISIGHCLELEIWEQNYCELLYPSDTA